MISLLVVGAVHVEAGAVFERGGLREVEPDRPGVPAVEPPAPTAEHDGVDDEAQLREESCGEQTFDEGDAPGDGHPAVALGRQLVHRMGDIAAATDDPGLRSGGVLLGERVRKDDLLHAVELSGQRRLVAAFRP